MLIMLIRGRQNTAELSQPTVCL